MTDLCILVDSSLLASRRRLRAAVLVAQGYGVELTAVADGGRLLLQTAEGQARSGQGEGGLGGSGQQMRQLLEAQI